MGPAYCSHNTYTAIWDAQMSTGGNWSEPVKRKKKKKQNDRQMHLSMLKNGRVRKWKLAAAMLLSFIAYT